MASEEESLIYSPTWVIASTCGFFIISSLVLERAVYFIGHLLVKHKLISLESAFEKVKEELMMVGFISIALTLGQNGFAKICVPTKVFTSMLLCKKPHNDTMIEEAMTLAIRGLQETETTQTTHSTVCKEDHTPFMPPERLHQLHILLFLLVITHVVYTLIIVALGMLSIRHWKAWEDRALAKEELSVTDDVRLTRETTFMRARALNRWKTNMFTSYLVAFFQQFHNVVHEIDYHTLRYGFIMSHMPNNPRFSFYKYIRRSFQDDFKYVVGVRPGLWVYSIVWLLLNVDGWESNIIFTAMPLILILAIGTKLQHIITKMAIHFNDRNALTVGMPNVEPNDKLFWFHRPRFILYCIHFILFQNALEISFDVWAAITFPPDNCIYRQPGLLLGRISIGLAVLMLCGLVTLPIYALVSQMGSNVKRAIFEEHIQLAVRRWHKQAKATIRTPQDVGESSSRSSHASEILEDDPPQVDAYPIEMADYGVQPQRTAES